MKITSYKGSLNQSDCKKLLVHLWNYTKQSIWEYCTNRARAKIFDGLQWLMFFIFFAKVVSQFFAFFSLEPKILAIYEAKAIDFNVSLSNIQGKVLYVRFQKRMFCYSSCDWFLIPDVREVFCSFLFFRDHIFQLYRGRRRFCQDVFVTPTRLVVGSHSPQKTLAILDKKEDK